MLKDGLFNALTGLGGGTDRNAGSAYRTKMLTDDQLLDVYRGASIAAKIVDIPALDATREWRAWGGMRPRPST